MQIDRRNFIWTATVAGLQPLSTAAGSAVESAIVMGKRLSDLDGLDPHVSISASSQEIIGNLYETLVVWDAKKGVFAPGLAKQVPEWTDARREWKIELAPGRLFSSGNPVRASDVVFSLQRSFQVSPLRSSIFDPLGFSEANISECIKAVDETVTIRIPLEGAPHLLLPCLCATACAIVEKFELIVVPATKTGSSDAGGTKEAPKNAEPPVKPKWLLANSAGTGRFQVKDVAKSDAIELCVNRYYPDAKGLRTLIIRDIPDPGVQLKRLETKESKIRIDIARDVLPEAVEAKKKIYASGAEPKANLLLLAMNTSHELLNSESKRQTVRTAINIDAIAPKMEPMHWAKQAAFCPRLICDFGLEHAFAPKKIDAVPAHPLRLLHAEGTPRSLVAELIADQLAKIGVPTTLEPATGRDLIARFRKSAFDLALITWASDYPHPYGNAQAFCPRSAAAAAPNPPTTLASCCKWEDASVADLLKKVRTLDDAKQTFEKPESWKAQYLDLAKALNAKSPYVFLMEESGFFVARRHSGTVSLGGWDCMTRYNTERT